MHMMKGGSMAHQQPIPILQNPNHPNHQNPNPNTCPLDENMSNLTSASGDQASVSSNNQQSSFLSPNPNPAKKKRSLPGNPDPEAEVVALSPRSLLATNRFVCEICNKGFQRDQNLQLHRRGHNLPWKLKQRSSKEARKKVYVCPEATCVHHDPSRALGDLTGIKKHFCRKHGEKKWKCEKCSKKYAVQSDWKAHSKTCGTREYRCDCGTLFSRRDSFITHRAFCDALAEESARRIITPPNPNPNTIPIPTHFPIPPPNQNHPPKAEDQQHLQLPLLPPWYQTFPMEKHQPNQYNNNNNPHHTSSPSHMSATALLQRAAQIGATTVNGRASQMAPLLSPSTSSMGLEGFDEEGFGLIGGMLGMRNGKEEEKDDGGMTRDFLGLTAFSHHDLLDIAGLADSAAMSMPMSSSSCKRPDQSKGPWDG